MPSQTVHIRSDLWDRLYEYCKRNNVSISEVVNRVLEIALPVLEAREHEKA
jgi:predicted CopG family antitoxin